MQFWNPRTFLIEESHKGACCYVNEEILAQLTWRGQIAKETNLLIEG